MKKTIAVLFVAMGVLSTGLAGDGGWLTDYNKALALSAKTGKPILADFAGSDWCGWCIKLDREVFSTKAFKEFAKKNLILLLVDFPRAKPQSKKIANQNQNLAMKYGVQVFPTVLILDAKGKLIATTGYREGGAENYIKHLKGIITKKQE